MKKLFLLPLLLLVLVACGDESNGFTLKSDDLLDRFEKNSDWKAKSKDEMAVNTYMVDINPEVSLLIQTDDNDKVIKASVGVRTVEKDYSEEAFNVLLKTADPTLSKSEQKEILEKIGYGESIKVGKSYVSNDIKYSYQGTEDGDIIVLSAEKEK